MEKYPPQSLKWEEKDTKQYTQYASNLHEKYKRTKHTYAQEKMSRIYTTMYGIGYVWEVWYFCIFYFFLFSEVFTMKYICFIFTKNVFKNQVYMVH